MASLETSQQLTRERFHELLLAYMGAMHHCTYVHAEYGLNAREYRLACEAAVRALQEFEKAVFP